MNTRKLKTIAISGGFDPVHIGHVRMMQEAKAMGNRLVVIINNDNWLKKKKGYTFMPEDERAAVIAAIKYVDDVIITSHPKDPQDMSVCNELEQLKPDVFANGGDRKADNIPEYQLCEKLGIDMAFNVGGGKAQSSSELIKRVKAVST